MAEILLRAQGGLTEVLHMIPSPFDIFKGLVIQLSKILQI